MREEKFTVPLPGLLLFLLLLGGTVAVGARLDLSPPTWGRESAKLSGLLLFPVIFSWVAWRVGGRSKFARVAVFYIVFGMLAIDRLAFMAGSMRNQQTAEDLQNEVKRYQAELKEEFEQQGSLTMNTQRTARLIDAIERSGDQMPDNERGVVDAATRYLRKIQAGEQQYQTSLDKLPVDNIMQPKTLTNLAQLPVYQAGVSNFMQANEELKVMIANSSELFEQELIRAGLSENMRASALAGFQKSARERNVIVVQIREQDARLGTNLLGLLDLYRSEWGKWEWNEQEEGTTFQEAAATEKFQHIMLDIQELAAEQEEAQGKLVQLGTPTP